VIRNNTIYGNYVVASRVIQGELLFEELPLSTAVYGTSDRLPLSHLWEGRGSVRNLQ